jgi:glycosyltransferase involved in cell wall biosynthesis
MIRGADVLETDHDRSAAHHRHATLRQIGSADDAITVLIIHQSAELYGSDRSLIDFLHGVDRARFSPLVCVPEHGPFVDVLASLGIEVHVTPVLKAGRRTLTSPWNALKLAITTPHALRAITRLVNGRRIDLVYTNTIAVMAGSIWATMHRVPHIWHVREIIHRPRIASLLYRALVPALSARIICNSDQTRRWISPASTTAVTVWNGVPTVAGDAMPCEARSVCRAALRLSPDTVLVLMPGRINGWKGQDLLLDAVDEISPDESPSFHLLLIGGAAFGKIHLLDKLTQRIENSRHRHNISLHVFSEDMAEFYLASDLVVVPSRRPEPFGRVAIEAMAYGLPVIAARHGGLVEIVRHGETGMLFEPNDSHSLHEALTVLLGDAALRRRLGAAGQVRQRELFAVGTYVRKLETELQCAHGRHSFRAPVGLRTIRSTSSGALRVAFFHQSADLYGSDRVLLELVTALRMRGVEPVVLLPCAGPLAVALERAGVTVRILPVFKIARSVASPAGLLRLLREVPGSLAAIDAALDGLSIDIVHSNTLAVLAGALWARRRGIPHVWHVHEILERPWLARMFLPLAARLLSDRVVCNSRATQAWLVSEQPQLAQRSTVIWNGVSPPQPVSVAATATLSSAMRVAGCDVVIGLVGRINRWKGHVLLIEAAEILAVRGLHHFSVVFVGSPVAGQEHIKTSLVDRIASCTVSRRISLLDFHEDIWPIWSAIDICCVPSTEPEPFGMVALEAMAVGKAVVAANHGGLPEIVDDGTTGLLFEPNNAIALADALSRLISDRPLRTRMGAAARHVAALKFSTQEMSGAFLDCYQTMLRKPSVNLAG